MNTQISTDISRRHDTIAAAVLASVVGLAGLAALLSAALDATGHPVLVAAALGFAALLIGSARWVARRVRERREDAADALAGAAWRAEHLLHLAAPTATETTTRMERGRAGVA
jgi:hypothetical protein